MEIRLYTKNDETALFELLENEGDEWADYHTKNKEKYKAALENSITYVACEEKTLCGYCRCRNDGGFGIYVLDLLADKKYRGKQIGRKLMTQVCIDFPEADVYVMSDVDGYYEK